MIDVKLYIDIDCYTCGENIAVPFRLGVQEAAYAYCSKCKSEGVAIDGRGISDTGTLSITRLQGE